MNKFLLIVLIIALQAMPVLGQPAMVEKNDTDVPLQEHLEKIFNQRFESLEKEITEARRLMEKTMADFPGAYAKKLELEQTALTLKELKDKDLREMKELINSRITKEEYNNQHDLLLKKAQGWETIIADINGRLWVLGFILTGLIVAFEIVFRFFLKR